MTDTGLAVLKTLRDSTEPMTVIQLSEHMQFCARKIRGACTGAVAGRLARDPYPRARSRQYEITEAGRDLLTEMGE